MSNNIKHPTKDEFELILNDNEVVFVDFWATWCGPCQMISPIIEQIADEYVEKMPVVKIDIDQNSELAEEYKIMSIPTVILFKDGKEVQRLVGAKSSAEYISEIKNILG